MDMFNIHKLGSSSPKQRKGQLAPSQNQVCPMKVTTVYNRLFLPKTYLTKKILRLSILTFWVYKYYVKCWVCHKTALNILGLRQTQEFWSGSTQISFGSMYFGSHLDTPFKGLSKD